MACFPALRTRWLCSAALAGLFTAGAQAQELPTGGQVVAGSASIAAAGQGLAIRQASGRAVIDWKSFGIGAGGKVTIDQPDSKSALLNRVTGGDISKIAGSLSSNGQVFLINRNGIVITPTGTIDTRGGFVGSTLDISNDDFMAGRLRFHGANGGLVLNQGRISGGAIALLGANVANEGLIVSPLGRVALGSGEQATLDLSGDGYLQVLLPAGATDASGRPLVSNSGRIEAEGGMVVLSAATARAAVRQTVNMSGVIAARSVSGHDGVVTLDGGARGQVTVSGEIDASGDDSGGRIDISGGDSVTLTGATLTATGGTRGGLVRIGGAFQGGAPSSQATADQTDRFVARFGPAAAITAADTTNIDTAATINVSGGVTGGTAVVWSNLATTQAGQIRATGGITGGAIELSSHGTLATNLTRASAGAKGILLLDPANIGVEDDTLFPSIYPTASTLPAGGSPYSSPGANPDTTYFKVGDVLAQMNAGTDVVLRASNDLSWNASNAAVDFGAAHTGNLTLSAGRNVSVGGYLTLYGSSLSIIANDSAANGVIDADRQAGNATIDTFNAIISAQVGSGQTPGNISLTLGTGAGLTNQGIGTLNRIGEIAGGNITLSTSGQNSTWAFFPATAFGGNAISPVTIAALGAVSISGSISGRTNGGLTFSGSSVTWTDEATRSVSNNSGGFVAFVENGVTTRWGNGLDGGNMTRVSLGKGSAYSPITYGDTAPAAVQYRVTSGTLKGSDTLATLAGALSGLSTSGMPGAGSAAGAYTVTTSAAIDTAGAPSGYFFNLTSATDTIRINPKTIVPTVTSGSYAYGSPSAVVSLSGVIGGDVVTPLAALDSATAAAMTANGSGFGFAAQTGAGSHIFTLTGLTGAAATNYALDTSGTLSASLTIARKALTYQIYSVSAVYGTTGSTTAALGGALAGDDVSLGAITSTGFATTARVGTYAITGSGLAGAASANYSLATTGNSDGVLTITPKPLTYVATGGSSVYGDTPTLATPTLSGVINGDQVSAVPLANGVASGVSALSNSGNYTITAGIAGADAANYSATAVGSTSATYTIAKRPVTFALAGNTGVYGTPAALLTVTGLIGTDGVEPTLFSDGSRATIASLGSGTYGVSAVDAGSHSIVLASLSGAGAFNYSYSLTGIGPVTYAVSPKPLTYSISDVTATYRVDPNLPIVSVAGAIGGDTITGQLLLDGRAINDPLDMHALAIGTYTFTLGTLSGVHVSNYTLATTGNRPGTLTVANNYLSYSLGDVTATYGSLASLPTATIIGAPQTVDVHGVVGVSANGIGITLGARTGVGTYLLTVTSLTGADAANYALSATGNTPGHLTITPRPITYSIAGGNSVYGQPLSPSTPVFNGVVSGDSVTGSVGYSTGNIQDQPLFALSSRPAVGTYYLGLMGITGADAGNYTLARTGNSYGQYIVSAKHLSYQAVTASMTYGDSQAVLPGATLVGVETGDDVRTQSTVVLANGQQYTSGFGISVGTYTLASPSIFGNQAANYVLDNASGSAGTLTITPRPVTGSVFLFDNSVTAVYGSYSATQALARGILSNVAGNDSNALTPVVSSTALKASSSGALAAGSYTFTVSGLSGSAASNYTLSASDPATLTITPKALSADATGFSSIYGTQPAVSRPATAGVLSGDDVGFATLAVTNATGNPITLATQTPVGTYTVSTSGLSGADAANYSFAATTATLTISPKPITYSTATTGWTYGDAPTLAAVTLSGLVGSDSVTANRAITFSGRTNAGSYSDTVANLSGAPAGNYVLAGAGNSPGTITVAQRPLSFVVSAPTQTITYLDPVPSFGALAGVLPGDNVGVQTFLSSTNGFTDASTIAPAGTADVYLGRLSTTANALTGASAANYTLPSSSTTLTKIATLIVNKRGLTYSATAPGTAIYGDTVGYSFSLSGAPAQYLAALTPYALVDGVTYANPQSGFTAGIHAISAAVNDANFYVASGTPASITISKRALSYQITAPSNAIYGDTISYGISVQGNQTDKVLTDISTALRIDGQSYADPQSAFTVGTHVLSLALPSANYDLVAVPATISIAKRQLSYTLTTPSTATYGDTVAFTTSIQGDVPDRVKAEATPILQVDGKTYADSQTALIVGNHTISLALSSPNFSLTGQAATVAITKRALTLNLLQASTVYGTVPGTMVTLANVVRNDSFDIAVNVGDRTYPLSQTATGYGNPANIVSGTQYYDRDVGTYAVSIKSITGAALANYDLTTAGTGSLTVTPKPLSYTIASITGQYGGIATPADSNYPLAAGILQLGRISFPGLLTEDRSGVSGQVGVVVNGTAQAYSGSLVPGTYTQAALGLSGSRAQNYTLATTGNTIGALTLTPAVLETDVGSGGRLYFNGDRSTYQNVGTPGTITYTRSAYSEGQNLYGSDNVAVVVQIYKDGQPYTDTAFPVGSYELRPISLIGPDAYKYRMVPSQSGTLLVQDSSVFSFGFLSDTPNSIYTPPASVTTFTSSISAQGGGSASAGRVGTSFVATASGGGSATASLNYGIATISATAGGSASTTASFGPTGIAATATAGANASVTLSVGPASYTYGADGTVLATATVDRNGVTVTGSASADLNQSLTVGGSLGGGVSGSSSTTANLFATAETQNAVGYKDGKVVVSEKQWVGVGASAGTSGSISGGGVSGSASVTVYSPGSLGLGAGTNTGYTNGTVTVGFTLSISIGIGGLSISPSFSFDAAGAVQSVSDFANDLGSKLFGVGCDAGCRAGKAAEAAKQNRIDLFNQADDMLKANNGVPTLQLMNFIAAHPSVAKIDSTDIPGEKFSDLVNLYVANQTYGNIPDKLNSVVQQEQALVQKLQSSPGSLSFEDMQAAQNLRAQEATLIGQLNKLGGKVQVANGTIGMVAK